MSEKRFKMEIPINNGNHPLLKDNETGEIVEIVNVEILIKRMNEQQATITELEKNFEDLVNWSTEISKRNVLLDEKIGRLQQENKELKNKLNKHL